MPAKGTWIEQVNKRTRNGKKRVDSLDPRHFAVDVSIGSIHYKENGEWLEIDNIFEPAIAPWDWQMLKAGYHIRVKEDFTAGQIIEFEKQGETIQFQPMALEWTNDLDQIQQVSMPQDVTPTITNPEVDLLPAVGMPSHQGTIRWDNAYGEGIDFEWRCTATRLVKILEVENLNKLPVPEQYILDGGNPVLRLNLIFDSSKDVNIYVDGEKWDKKAKKLTFKAIEFRKDGKVLWGFMPLRYWDSEDNQGQSVATLEKRGNKLYISIRVPYEWLQSAVYPVFIDTTVDEQVEANEDDAYENEGEGTVNISDTTSIRMNSHTVAAGRYWAGYRFVSGEFPAQGTTIDVAYLSIYLYSTLYDDANLNIHFEELAAPATFTTDSYSITSRDRTEASVEWIADGIAAGALDWYNSPSLCGVGSPIQELFDAYSPTAIVAITRPNTDAYKIFYTRPHEFSTGEYATKLHIEYTAGGEIVEGSAAGSGVGLATASAKLDVLASVLGNGIGLSQSSSYLIISGLASGEGIGLASATGEIVGIIVEGTGAGSGIGTATAQTILDIIAQVQGSGIGLGVVIIEIVVFSSDIGLGIERASRAGWLMEQAVYTKEAFDMKTYTGK